MLTPARTSPAHLPTRGAGGYVQALQPSSTRVQKWWWL